MYLGKEGSGMIIEEDPQQDFCRLVGLLTAYLEKHTDGADRVKEFLLDEQYLWTTEDVCTFTGWCRTYIQRLVSNGQLPYIPGKPHKFIPASVKKTLEQMQQGGIYGKRKNTLKTKTTTKGRK